MKLFDLYVVITPSHEEQPPKVRIACPLVNDIRDTATFVPLEAIEIIRYWAKQNLRASHGPGYCLIDDPRSESRHHVKKTSTVKTTRNRAVIGKGFPISTAVPTGMVVVLVSIWKR